MEFTRNNRMTSRKATIDSDRLTVQIRSFIRGQKGNDVCNLSKVHEFLLLFMFS